MRGQLCLVRLKHVSGSLAGLCREIGVWISSEGGLTLIQIRTCDQAICLNRQKKGKHRLDKDAGAVWTRLRPVLLPWRRALASLHFTGNIRY
jgi:hypothetical protein